MENAAMKYARDSGDGRRYFCMVDVNRYVVESMSRAGRLERKELYCGSLAS